MGKQQNNVLSEKMKNRLFLKKRLGTACRKAVHIIRRKKVEKSC